VDFVKNLQFMMNWLRFLAFFVRIAFTVNGKFLVVYH